jgi:DNA-binding NarL/FixJ family response regulator
VSIIKVIKNGAGGYILKESQPYELYKAVGEISTRHVFVNELVSGKMMHSLQNNTGEFETSLILHHANWNL